MDNLFHFEKYTNLGMKVIALYPKTKIPIGSDWNTNWNRRAAEFSFQMHPSANMGLLLGDIVDVEGDSLEANQILDDLIGDYHHPCYRGSKSIHHLFLNPDAELTRKTRDGIEFRGHLHQSTLPPSRHPDGTEYQWIVESFPVPPMPPALLKFYQEKFQETVKRKTKSKPIKKKNTGYMLTQCNQCFQKISIHRKRLKLEVLAFRERSQLWQCQSCRRFDLRKICKKLRRTV